MSITNEAPGKLLGDLLRRRDEAEASKAFAERSINEAILEIDSLTLELFGKPYDEVEATDWQLMKDPLVDAFEPVELDHEDPGDDLRQQAEDVAEQEICEACGAKWSMVPSIQNGCKGCKIYASNKHVTEVYENLKTGNRLKCQS